MWHETMVIEISIDVEISDWMEISIVSEISIDVEISLWMEISVHGEISTSISKTKFWSK